MNIHEYRAETFPRAGNAKTGCDSSGIGGDPVKGTEYIDVLEWFLGAKDTGEYHHDRRDRWHRRGGSRAVMHGRDDSAPASSSPKARRAPGEAVLKAIG